MAKTKSNLGSPGVVSLSRLRGAVKAPQSRTPLDYVWHLPDAGVLDLSQHPDHRPLPPELLSSVAPLSVITESAEQAAAVRHQLANSVSEAIGGNPAFLPPEYYDPNDPGQITLQYQGLSTVIDRGRDLDARLSGRESADLDQRPLELLVREQYRPPDAGIISYGLGHYVYDPLTDRWLIVQRWGRGQMSKRKRQIEPYAQWGALANRHRNILAQLEGEPLPEGPEERALASQQQLEDVIRRRRRA